jgi:quinoprotein glucose dehydrogenase
MSRTDTVLRIAGLALVLAAACVRTADAQSPDASDWGSYGGDVYGNRFSSLDQIDRNNVAQLQVAWEFHTGELGEGFASAEELTFESTPVLAYGMLYLETATNIVIALDPETGKQRWRYDPRVDRTRHYSQAAARGVTVWEDETPGKQGACLRRVFTGTLDARLIALDAMTGQPCEGFGTNGAIDLTQGIRIRDRSEYTVTSPPAVVNNVVVVGSAVGDNRATDVERGVIRAYDAMTGAPKWAFDPLPDSPTHPAAAAWDLSQAAATGAANSWAPMSVDPDKGLVFAPTGSASPDFYGGKRLGDNRFANSLLALDANTGQLRWHQQLIHHDLWDYDLAAQPALVEMERRGAPMPAVIQATKSGMVFVFERDTGKPVFGMREQVVPQSTVPGEMASPTQPFSALPALVEHRPLGDDDAWGITFWDRAQCRRQIRKYRNEGVFTPPDTRGTIMWPGHLGGVNWGGIAYDPRSQRVLAAVNHIPMVVTLMSPAEMEKQRASGEYPRSEFSYQRGAPYAMRREPLLSSWGLPCNAPPWGSLVSLDLRTNRIAWQVPLGSTENLTPWFMPERDFGTPNLGGPIVTAGNLVFVAGTMDRKLRAFDLETGRELWKHALPAGGQATPMTYRAGKAGRQYIVIAAGGHGPLGVPRSDSVVAFALPAGRSQ